MWIVKRGGTGGGTGDVQLLADCSSGFGGAAALNPDDFYQLDDAGEVVFVVSFAGQILDLDRYGRVGLFLFQVSVSACCEAGLELAVHTLPLNIVIICGGSRVSCLIPVARSYRMRRREHPSFGL
jgi:hypothetical protein